MSSIIIQVASEKQRERRMAIGNPLKRKSRILTLDEVEALRASTSPILLKNTTI